MIAQRRRSELSNSADPVMRYIRFTSAAGNRCSWSGLKRRTKMPSWVRRRNWRTWPRPSASSIATKQLGVIGRLGLTNSSSPAK